jgi:hypothetical protein
MQQQQTSTSAVRPARWVPRRTAWARVMLPPPQAFLPAELPATASAQFNPKRGKKRADLSLHVECTKKHLPELRGFKFVFKLVVVIELSL